MNILDIVFISIGIPIGIVAMLRLIKVNDARKLAALVARERSFSTGKPTECLKCGNSKSNPLGLIRTSPVFHSPRHYDRSTSHNRPEHLSYSCWYCSHVVMVRVEDQYD